MDDAGLAGGALMEQMLSSPPTNLDKAPGVASRGTSAGDVFSGVAYSERMIRQHMGYTATRGLQTACRPLSGGLRRKEKVSRRGIRS